MLDSVDGARTLAGSGINMVQGRPKHSRDQLREEDVEKRRT